MLKLDIRKVNSWLKGNVPFFAKAEKTRDGYLIFADSGKDLSPYLDALKTEFNLKTAEQPGLKNYISVPFWQ